jgi:hypothetical protein
LDDLEIAGLSTNGGLSSVRGATWAVTATFFLHAATFFPLLVETLSGTVRHRGGRIADLKA